MGVVTYKCPNCGGALEFNGDEQNWKCEFCLSVFDESQVKAFADDGNKDLKIQQEKDDKEFNERARIYTCSSCGAEIVTDDTTAATFCYYCHSPAILPGRLSGEYRPARVIPFKFERDKAVDIFIGWCRKKPLLSKKFISSSQLEKLSGMYIPFWLFDCNLRGKISAEARNIRTWTSGNRRYTETKYYNILRAGTARFKGVPADGSKKMDDSLMETLEPYDYSQMQDFSMSYLSGYLAEKYDMNQRDVYGGVAKRVEEYIKTLLSNTINGYQSVTIKDCSIDIYESKADYVLLPAWMFTYNYKGRTYMFAMNGQTGKIAGSLPLSRGRMAAWFGAISAIMFAILFVGGMFLW